MVFSYLSPILVMLIISQNNLMQSSLKSEIVLFVIDILIMWIEFVISVMINEEMRNYSV